ncbi:ankyrin repeat-containing domain protein [Catenaria anguillulae PL171]|uniref:Ankyrin repeat-containing domain protein n=1 Tax=Catenaria anguillulae PL171 TaxID=765915 RepID=A0A1Y2I238_9FUNG|nr:ankyrin repeat-containing domain protein [Catenaria anguillulae PL171]
MLTLDICDTILVVAIRLGQSKGLSVLISTTTLTATDVCRTAIQVASREHMTLVNRLALLVLPPPPGHLTHGDAASARGDFAILGIIAQLCRAHRLGIKRALLYTSAAIAESTKHGRREVLNWWLQHSTTHGGPIPLLYWHSVLDWESVYGDLNGLNWWFDSGLDLRFTEAAMDGASAKGNVAALAFWMRVAKEKLESTDALQYTERSLNEASANGHLDTVQWWFDSGLPLKYSHTAVDLASANGHLDIVKAWAGSGHSFRYTAAALDGASRNGHVHVLQWFLASGRPMQYTRSAFHDACAAGHVAVLEWFTSSGLQLRYEQAGLDAASENGHLAVLEWFAESGLREKYDSPVEKALLRGHVDVADWWLGRCSYRGIRQPNLTDALEQATFEGNLDAIKRLAARSEWPLSHDLLASVVERGAINGNLDLIEWAVAQVNESEREEFFEEVLYYAFPLDCATMSGHLHVLKYFKAHDIYYEMVSEDAVKAAAASGYVEILQWWKDELGASFIFPPGAVKCACSSGAVATLEWWFKSGLSPVLYDQLECARAMVHGGHVECLQWWVDKGFPLNKNSYEVMDTASELGHVQILSWWLQFAGPERVAYSEAALDLASKQGHVAVLEWWQASQLPLLYSDLALNDAIAQGQMTWPTAHNLVSTVIQVKQWDMLWWLFRDSRLITVPADRFSQLPGFLKGALL